MDCNKNATDTRHVDILSKSFQGDVLTDFKSVLNQPTIPKTYKDFLQCYCKDCGLILTSESQAQQHFLGKRHQNVVKNKDTFYKHGDAKIRLTEKYKNVSKNVSSYDKLKDECYFRKLPIHQCWRSKCGPNNLPDIIPPPAGRDNILETVMKNDKKMVSSSDLSIYRTPSGKYYCQPCNLTVNSQAQFLQHSESRKHKHKATRAFYKIK